MMTLIILLALWGSLDFPRLLAGMQRNEKNGLVLSHVQSAGIPKSFTCKKEAGVFWQAAHRAVAHRANSLARSNNQLACFLQ